MKLVSFTVNDVESLSGFIYLRMYTDAGFNQRVECQVVSKTILLFNNSYGRL